MLLKTRKSVAYRQTLGFGAYHGMGVFEVFHILFPNSDKNFVLIKLINISTHNPEFQFFL